MKTDPKPLLGQITTLATLIASNPNINQQTKLAAHTLATNAKLWIAGKVSSDVIVKELDQLTKDIRLLVI